MLTKTLKIKGASSALADVGDFVHVLRVSKQSPTKFVCTINKKEEKVLFDYFRKQRPDSPKSEDFD